MVSFIENLFSYWGRVALKQAEQTFFLYESFEFKSSIYVVDTSYFCLHMDCESSFSAVN